MNGIIICEGKTDAILISYGMTKLSEWKYIKPDKAKKMANLAFPTLDVEWYQKEESIIGVICANGTSFQTAVSQVLDRNAMQFAISDIIILTDHDDSGAEKERLNIIADTIKKYIDDDIELGIGEWNCLEIKDKQNRINKLRICYDLIPEQEFGAMETFVANSIASRGTDEKQAAEQVQKFVDDFKSNKFLRKRRERIKAKLSVLISVISPDRTFTTLDEYLQSVEWKEFGEYREAFRHILELGDSA